MTADYDYTAADEFADEIIVEFLPGQYEFATSKKPQTALIGGLGSGKTYAGCAKAVITALDERNWAHKGFIGANTYKQLEEATLATLFEFMEEKHIWFDYQIAKSRLWIEDRPEPILCYSLENYNVVRGIKFGFVWIDETARSRAKAFDVLVGRLRGKGATNTFDITTTPDGFNWLYDKFVTECDDNPKVRKLRGLVHASTYENYHLPDSYFRNLEATYDELMLRQEVGGEFINIFGGRCYRTFSRAQNMPSVIKPNSSYPLDLCLDFNVDPMSSVICQQLPRMSRKPSQIVAVDEIVLPFSDTESVCNEFVRRYPRWNAGVRVYGDASGGHGNTAGKTDYQVVRDILSKRYRVSIDVPRANPPVVDRVNSVNALFRERSNTRQDRVIGMVSKGKCPKLVRDLEQVAFKPGTRDINKTDPELTHSTDAFGYYVFRVARLGRYTGPPVRTVAARNR